MADKQSEGLFLMGFVVGGVLGVVAGLLLAPKPGSETRADLADYGEVVRERAEEVAAQVRERVGPAVDTVRDAVGPVIEQMAGARSSGDDGSQN
jgi:gas vesicle protein